jgi:adenine/guanine phosphoribosyltransferase-like PRPP-binding protein
VSIRPSQRLLSNRGGGCIEHFEVIAAPPGHHVLRLHCPTAVITQLQLNEPQYANTASTTSTAPWTLRGSGPNPSPSTSALLDLLGRILSLPRASNVDFALALDWTKTPVDGVEPRQWPSTATGDLVKRGKYWYTDPQRAADLRQVGKALVRQLCAVVQEHPLLRDIDAIIAVPGHDSRQVSFGARVAASVAKERAMPLVRCGSSAIFRTPAKNLDLNERASAVNGQFNCPTNLTGQSVLIIDDLYGSGATASETARAARAAGATRVASLCGVRTMRSL